jgi:putative peptide zinc metalloprotease protein
MIGFFSIQMNLNPMLKMDGYWVISDLLGIPNLHAAASEYFINGLLKLFGIKKTSARVFNIGKKEKRYFGLYALTFNIFLVGMLLYMLKYATVLPKLIYSNVISLFIRQPDGFTNLVSVIFNNIALTITAILVVRVIYYTLYSMVKMLLEVAKSI